MTEVSLTRLMVLLTAVQLVACDKGKSRVAPAKTFAVDLAPLRQLDIVVLLDPPCCGKALKFTTQFSKLLQALRDPVDGTYPDLRIALIDSDLGTGGAYPSGPCGPNGDNGGSLYGDLGRFRMKNAAACGMSDGNALWIEYADGRPVNYVGTSDLSNVFACLVGGLGTAGCGVSQPLQAFEFALVGKGLGNETQQTMLRPYAQLALVFMSDTDDCSATPNDGLFGDKPELASEAAHLRCGTRAYACGGVNLSSAPPGYPTTEAFSAPFASCQARTDACPNPSDGDAQGTDTSAPTSCSPLKSIEVIADELKALKAVDHKVLAAGLIGWPIEGEMDTASYRIDLVPNPNSADTEHAQVYDDWPVCFDPDHPPKSSAYDADAWGSGAQAGLRLASFLDQFGDDGLRFSACERDYANALSEIGSALARRMSNACVSRTVEQYTSCAAHVLIPDGSGGYVLQATGVPRCQDPSPQSACYTLTADDSACPGELVVSLRATEVTPGTVLRFDCPS